MKLVVFLSLIIILVIPINIVSVQEPFVCPECGDPHNQTLHIDPNATKQQLQQEIQKNEEQRAHYLEIIRSLVILSIILGLVVIGFGVILYKKRNLKMKSNPET